jgi:hypothetical protein
VHPGMKHLPLTQTSGLTSCCHLCVLRWCDTLDGEVCAQGSTKIEDGGVAHVASSGLPLITCLSAPSLFHDVYEQAPMHEHHDGPPRLYVALVVLWLTDLSHTSAFYFYRTLIWR